MVDLVLRLQCLDLPVARKAHRIVGDDAVFKLPHTRCKAVDEIAVVAHEQERPVVALHRLFDPLARRDIEVVRRLVEDQEIHFLIHQDAELEARKLAAREHADALKNVLAREVERGQAVARALRRDVALGVEHRVDQVSFRHVEFDDLRQVRDAHRRAELDLALVGIFLFHQHLDERRLARAVVANERDALAAAHLQVHVVEQHTVAEALFELFEREHLVAVEFLRLELRAQCPFLRRLVRRAHTLDALFHRQRAAVRLVHALEGKHAQLLGALFKLGNLGLLLFVLAHLFQIAALFFHRVEAVVAAVKLRLAVEHLDDAGDGTVQKVAVMRDGDDRTLER